MPIYKIQMPNGSDNTIVAEQDFIDQYFPGGELIPDPVPEPPPQPQTAESGAPGADLAQPQPEAGGSDD